jgi:hypothetical protein
LLFFFLWPTRFFLAIGCNGKTRLTPAFGQGRDEPFSKPKGSPHRMETIGPLQALVLYDLGQDRFLIP